MALTFCSIREQPDTPNNGVCDPLTAGGYRDKGWCFIQRRDTPGSDSSPFPAGLLDLELFVLEEL